MPENIPIVNTELSGLLTQALQGDPSPLEAYLTDHSNLPGPRMNTALATDFARLIGQLVAGPNVPVDALESLLDGWAALSLEAAPVNKPQEILPATATLSYGYVAVQRPDWWEDETDKLRRAASNPRWRTREMVATALQQMLKVDWSRTYQTLEGWLSDPDPLVIRAVVAAIAEPPLLNTLERGEQALSFQEKAINFLLHIPDARRKDEGVKVLRQALGYTLSVAVAAAPELGVALLEKLATSSDPDIQWIVRENWKKNRLKPYQKATT